MHRGREAVHPHNDTHLDGKHAAEDHMPMPRSRHAYHHRLDDHERVKVAH